jgi:hypothetical protein
MQRRPSLLRAFADERRNHFIAAFAIGVGALYYVGVLGEQIAGSLLAAGVLVVAGWYVARRLLEASSDRTAARMASALGILVVLIGAVPVVTTLAPGSPVASGTLAHPGDHIDLPEDVHGHLRLLVHAQLAGSGSADVYYGILADQQTLQGHLERRMRAARLGRRVRTSVADSQDTEYLPANIEASHALTLASLRGPVEGGLEVSVFRDRFPLTFELVAAALLSAFVALVAARRRAAPQVVAVTVAALCFATLVYLWATPSHAVGPEIGAGLVAGFAGSAVGFAIAWLSRKLVPA